MVSIKKNIKKHYRELISLCKFIKNENKLMVKLPFRNRLFCYKHGFYSRSYKIFNFKEVSYKFYLSDYLNISKTQSINEKYKNLLNDKFLFEKHFLNSGFNIPKSICLIRNKNVFPTNENVSGISQILEISKTSDLFLKPIIEGGGDGIMVISYDSGFLLDNSQISESDLIETITQKCNDHLVYRKFIQKGFSSRFYPPVVNTIRVHTYLDPANNLPFIGYAFHRFGNSKSGFLDNIQKSGLWANINLDTGIMNAAVSRQISGLIFYDRHPDTNIQIKGATIPYWDLIKQTLLDLSGKTFYLPNVGWDVILSDEEIYILEGNSNPTIGAIQINYPLLKNQKIADFYKYHGVI